MHTFNGFSTTMAQSSAFLFRSSLIWSSRRFRRIKLLPLQNTYLLFLNHQRKWRNKIVEYNQRIINLLLIPILRKKSINEVEVTPLCTNPARVMRRGSSQSSTNFSFTSRTNCKSMPNRIRSYYELNCPLIDSPYFNTPYDLTSLYG